MQPDSRDDYEELEGALDPHRTEEVGAAAAEAVARLRDRGVTVSASEGVDEVAALLDAVERFEAVVKAHGGDLMVDDLKSSRPDDQHFVLPRRLPGERLRAYVARIDEAAAGLRRHPRRRD